ncbi:MAG: cytochrome c peroxidase [Oceanicoccus sp.]
MSIRRLRDYSDDIQSMCFLLCLLWSVDSFGLEETEPLANFILSVNCPPSFEKTDGGQCKLHTLYDQYDSIQNHGVGGLNSSLPPRRDGFTPEQIDLGRYLFFDPLLSIDGTLSCASCHHPEKGLSDDKSRSIGVAGVEVARSAPTLWNSAFLTRFFWDARATTLEQQMLGPLYDPLEMGNNPTNLLATLNANVIYPRLFQQAFNSGADGITLDQIYLAITAFETSLISLNSRYDRYAHGFHQALNQQEIDGLNIFRSFVARCAECHQPPLFTNQQIAVIGTPEPEGMPLDIGAEKTFNSTVLKGGFKVPTLRNIATTAPYMHSGRFDNLRDTVEFYTKGRGHAVPKGVEMQLHWHIWEPELSSDELDLLVVFLQTLTDETFMPKTPERVPSGLAPISDGKN